MCYRRRFTFCMVVTWEHLVEHLVVTWEHLVTWGLGNMGALGTSGFLLKFGMLSLHAFPTSVRTACKDSLDGISPSACAICPGLTHGSEICNQRLSDKKGISVVTLFLIINKEGCAWATSWRAHNAARARALICTLPITKAKEQPYPETSINLLSQLALAFYVV